jgi:hypothetical protein
MLRIFTGETGIASSFLIEEKDLRGFSSPKSLPVYFDLSGIGGRGEGE